jgi:tRNA dimethylallyltransferase
MVNPSKPTELFPAWDALALVGPTASGKTAIALALAAEWPIEIISVDSALVYQGMDIGTAKPTLAERQAVVHHLIDIRDPAQSYSAADFARDATALIADIRGRGKLPLLVGGTMLYIKALIEGLDDLPLADPAVRADIEEEAHDRGWPALHAELALVDPPTAQRLPPHDAQRIARALEVWRITGKPLSSFFGTTRVAGPRVALLSLEPQDRKWLHQRIEQRFDAMLEQGLVDEVKALRSRGDLQADLPSMRCVGYRQAWEALNDIEEGIALATAMRLMRERGIAASRQLAKRQLTWLRGMPLRNVVACDSNTVLADVRTALAQWQT